MNKKEELMNSTLITIKEGSVEFYIHKVDNGSIPSKSMAVFYNRKMEINRDISNLAICSFNRIYNENPLVVMDSMAASGISSIRMLKECKNIKKIYINDINPVAVDLINKNIFLNKMFNHPADIEVSRKDANYFFADFAQNSQGYPNISLEKPNIISIDPFGTPNLYLDAAFKAIQNKDGLLCITATDTAVLFGVRPKSCIRKYLSKSLHTEYCKEIGARILVHFISRIANVNKMGIIPLLTFYSSHFLRVFCLTFKDRDKISQFFKSYGYLVHCNNCGFRSIFQDNLLEAPDSCPLCKEAKKISYAGPLWISDIHDLKLVNGMLDLNNQFQYRNKKRISKLLNLIREEINNPILYYNIHKLSKDLKISNIPKLNTIIEFIKKKGYQASRTHFDFLSIKTNMDINTIKETLIELEKKIS
ncbi:MAG: tRNA (guanine(10)-N(2))-dimethyltransferase [Promethearchaeota archaeon]|jgi:tRNA (guanine26-N2/guanine27-N2)-dimethyltransferase